MKKIILGLTIGLGSYCLYKKLEKEGYLDENKRNNEINKIIAKTRKKIKNTIANGKNEAEYLSERAEYAANRGKERLKSMIN